MLKPNEVGNRGLPRATGCFILFNFLLIPHFSVLTQGKFLICSTNTKTLIHQDMQVCRTCWKQGDTCGFHMPRGRH